MKHLRSIAALAACVLLAACTDYATFVTSTDIGINLDATTEQLNIGYVRAELFHGPGYPSEGAAPSAVGYISSDLSPFSPKIKQLYATGTAAELVTQNPPPPPAEERSDTLRGNDGRSSLAPEPISGSGSASLAMHLRACDSASTVKNCR